MVKITIKNLDNLHSGGYTTSMKVDIYKNLHNGKWSIRAADSRPRVMAHADEVTLCNVQFRVSQAGRARVLQEAKKNVHAFVRGDLWQWRGNGYKARDPFNPDIRVPVTYDWITVSYNPYKLPYFFNVETLEPVYEAEYAVFVDNKLFVKLLDNG